MLCALLEPGLMTVVDNELTIFSFSLVRLDKNRYGGGALLYIKDDLSYNACLWFLKTWNCHCTIVVATAFVYVYCTVQLHHSPCFATAVYFMQKVNLSFYSNFVFIGDFN